MRNNLNSKTPLKEREEQFQLELNKWSQTHSKDSYNKLWFYIYDCCTNIMLSKGKKHTIYNLEDKAMDATLKIMNKIVKENVRPTKLSSYCYYPCIEQLYGNKTRREENELDLIDNYEYTNYIDCTLFYELEIEDE